MCIIISKPAGVSLPSDEIIRNCFDSNPDGAGYAIANGKTVVISKGYFDIDELLTALHELDDVTNAGMLIHCRIATHGEVAAGTCHPFPVVSDNKALRATDTSNRLVIAHNGVISGMKTDKKTSDTMAYVRDVLTPLRRICEDMLNNDNALDIIEHTIGSKMAIMDNSGDIVHIGEFLEDENGVLYSNTSYLRKHSSYYRPISAWDNYDEFYGYNDDVITALPFSECDSCTWRRDCLESGAYCDDENDVIEYHEYDMMGGAIC